MMLSQGIQEIEASAGGNWNFQAYQIWWNTK